MGAAHRYALTTAHSTTARVNATRIRIKCHYCKRRIRPEHITRDHVVPKAKGGQNANWNYVPACAKCNNAKADNWPTCTCDMCWFAVALHAEIGITNEQLL